MDSSETRTYMGAHSAVHRMEQEDRPGKVCVAGGVRRKKGCRAVVDSNGAKQRISVS
jgi:hypothetical protein